MKKTDGMTQRRTRCSSRRENEKEEGCPRQDLGDKKPKKKGSSLSTQAKAKANQLLPSVWLFDLSGNGHKVAVIQFVKGAWDSGEKRLLEKFPELVTIKAMGEGFTWETQDPK